MKDRILLDGEGLKLEVQRLQEELKRAQEEIKEQQRDARRLEKDRQDLEDENEVLRAWMHATPSEGDRLDDFNTGLRHCLHVGSDSGHDSLGMGKATNEKQK